MKHRKVQKGTFSNNDLLIKHVDVFYSCEKYRMNKILKKL